MTCTQRIDEYLATKKQRHVDRTQRAMGDTIIFKKVIYIMENVRLSQSRITVRRTVIQLQYIALSTIYGHEFEKSSYNLQHEARPLNTEKVDVTS